MAEKGKFAGLYDELKAGRLSRREFTARALALGVGMPVVAFVLRAVPEAGAAPRPRNAGYALAAQGGAAARPAVGMENVQRGQGGELRMLQWQAVTTLSPHMATGTKDYLASGLIFESLMNYLPDGTLIPTLAKEVPSIENGLLAEDLTSATFNLLEGVTWSDGEPFTAEDVVFTWQWIMNPENASTSSGTWSVIQNLEAIDERTVRATYASPNANWFEPLTGSTWGSIYPKHILESGPEAHEGFISNPVGTGPYKVEELAPGDQAIFVINENYREPNKPFFDRVNIKGGGDAASAARAVLQTGDYDYAWNLQVEPQVLDELAQGGAGRVVAAPGTSVEAVRINFSDPNKEVNGQRSEKNTPHPYLTDIAVRRALNLAADRDTISRQFYAAELEPATADILVGIPSMDSPNTSYAFDVEQAKQILDEAGWTMDGDVRAKDGVELRMTFSTSINQVRQRTQAVLKDALEEIGFKVQLQQVDSGVFFSGTNEQDINHFYTDINMYTNNASTPFPTAYMLGWYAGPDGSNIAQAENDWNGQNNFRYNNPEYDRIFEQVRTETDLERAAELFIQLNDILINDVAVVPLVNRAADKYGISNTLREENVALGPFENNYWNIANWNRVEE